MKLEGIFVVFLLSEQSFQNLFLFHEQLLKTFIYDNDDAHNKEVKLRIFPQKEVKLKKLLGVF